MKLNVERVETWAAPLEDKPGVLAGRLSALADTGANPEFVLARRAPDRPGSGVVFVTPIKGASTIRKAQKAGFDKTESLHTLRITGTDKKGAVASIARRLAENKLNLRGLSAAVINKRFVTLVAFDTARDAAKALRTLRRL